MAHLVMQGGFEHFVGTEASRFSQCEFGVGIHAFDSGSRNLLLGAKPVEDQLAMAAQGARRNQAPPPPDERPSALPARAADAASVAERSHGGKSPAASQGHHTLHGLARRLLQYFDHKIIELHLGIAKHGETNAPSGGRNRQRIVEDLISVHRDSEACAD
jgi:hypothetical protein